MDQNNKCNLRCKMCGFSDSRVSDLSQYDMPRWLFDRIALQVFPRANYVCLSLMTEPFMTRDFADRLASVREAGLPFSEIITNGTLLTETACEKIVDARISRVIFSIDGGSKAVFEDIRVGARFETVLRNFALLRRVRASGPSGLPRLRINHVLSTANIDHFTDFLSLAASMQTDEVAVRTISRMSNAILQESTDEAFWQKVRGVRKELMNFCATTGIVDSAYLRKTHKTIELVRESGEKLLCPKPWDTLAIHPNGDMYPCMAWSRPPIGNLITDTFEDTWNGSALTDIRREFEDTQAGVDCLNCGIRRSAAADPDDDFFFRKVAKAPPPHRQQGE
ncbi:MAG: radical SAM protein [Thermoanaerobaculia bacterium]|nr:radical SAM protein [Thermoanaerobaculia bacterium]